MYELRGTGEHKSLNALVVDVGRIQVDIGSYTTSLDLNPFFPRGHCDVLPLRTLWLFK
jgi:hypothetical protein